MPYGLHKGKKMANVPADYLLWMYHEHIEGVSLVNMSYSNKLLKGYIEENLDVLKQEKINGSRKHV